MSPSFSLEGLSNKVIASKYRTALPDEKELAAEIEQTQVMLQGRKRITLTSSEVGRMKKKTKRQRSETLKTLDGFLKGLGI